jgi:hypothetical protein
MGETGGEFPQLETGARIKVTGGWVLAGGYRPPSGSLESVSKHELNSKKRSTKQESSRRNRAEIPHFRPDSPLAKMIARLTRPLPAALAPSPMTTR